MPSRSDRRLYIANSDFSSDQCVSTRDMPRVRVQGEVRDWLQPKSKLRVVAAARRVAVDFAACLFLSRYQLATRRSSHAIRPCQGKIEMSCRPSLVCAGIIPRAAHVSSAVPLENVRLARKYLG